MKYYAHSTENPDKSDWQELKDHLAKTAEKSAKFAEKFNHEEFGRIVGLFHDLGKYSQKFQRRLDGCKTPVDHATAGAIEVKKKYRELGEYILAHCIAGHHGGLLDTGSGLEEKHLTARLKKTVEDYLSNLLDYFQNFLTRNYSQTASLNQASGILRIVANL